MRDARLKERAPETHINCWKDHLFHGLQIKQIKNGIYVSQGKYIKDMLKKFGMDESKLLVHQWVQMEAWIVMLIVTWCFKRCIGL